MDTIPEDVSTIQQNLDNEALSRLPEINTSDTAEWRNWTFIFAIAIRSIQILIANFKLWIEEKLSYLRPGTIGWYAELAKSYQDGYDLIVKNDGSLGYAINDPESKIISAVSVTESVEGFVVFKLARNVNDELGPLTQDQLLRFKNYIELVKFVGTKTSSISIAADTVLYDITVYHNPAYDAGGIEAEVLLVLNNFKQSIGFDGLIYKQKLIQVIMAVEGVETIVLDTLEAMAFGGTYTPVNVFYTLASGYFNWDDTSTLTVTSISEL
jgi:hypothetical protein